MLDFHHAVRDGFLTLAREEPARFVVVDADQTPDDVAGAIAAVITDRLMPDLDGVAG